ncbi:hypothetical protein FACS189415_4550 [Bacteroidia bacterium]|nr:hypothetical protein FACS189415_4550 [Bacteroidia bacterium]
MNNTQYPIIGILKKALDWQGAPIPLSQIEETLLSQPDYPSIMGIAQTLECWGIKNFGFEVSIEELPSLDFPFITYLLGGEFIWVEKVGGEVQYWSEADGRQKVAFDKFVGLWNRRRIGLAFEEEKKPHKLFRLHVERSLGIGVLLLLWCYLAVFTWGQSDDISLVWRIGLVLANAVGMVLCYRIMRNGFSLYAKDISHATASFCWEIGVPVDSYHPRLSSSAKIFNLISWAELGLAYFSSVLLWTTLFSFIGNWLSVLWIFVLLAVPISLLALILQAVQIGRFCWPCCLIILLSWLNVGVGRLALGEFSLQNLPYLGLSLLLFFVACIAVVFIRNNRDMKRQFWLQEGKTAKVKYDMEYLKLQLKDWYEVSNAGFVWGDPDAANEITLYVDTLGDAAAEAVSLFGKAIDMYPQNRYRLIFVAMPERFPASYPHRTDMKGITFFSVLKRGMDTVSFFSMLERWYTSGWKRYFTLPQAVDTTAVDNEYVGRMVEFTSKTPIHSTPAILINGALLSSMYSGRDLFGIARLLNDEECTITKGK